MIKVVLWLLACALARCTAWLYVEIRKMRKSWKLKGNSVDHAMLVNDIQIVPIKDRAGKDGWTLKKYEMGAYVKNTHKDPTDILTGVLRAALFTLGWNAYKIVYPIGPQGAEGLSGRGCCSGAPTEPVGQNYKAISGCDAEHLWDAGGAPGTPGTVGHPPGPAQGMPGDRGLPGDLGQVRKNS